MPQSNKWVSQRIRKQFASKHHGSDTSTIYKAKNKKFKAQRARKKTLRQMASDYNDFLYQNQTDRNDTHDLDIAAASEQYYYPENYMENYRARPSTSTVEVKDINSVHFEAEYFYTAPPKYDIDARNRMLHSQSTTSSRWNWRTNIPRNVDEEQMALERAIAASIEEEQVVSAQKSMAHARDFYKFESAKGFAFANTIIRVRGNFGRHIQISPKTDIRRATNNPMKMANAAWNSYQNELGLRTLITITEDNSETEWNRSAGAPVELSGVLDVSIPELWSMHSMIFTFLGYDRLFRETFSLRMSMLKKKRLSARPNHGIIFYETRRDADTRIMSKMSYRIFLRSGFREIGGYTKKDWKQLRGLVSPAMIK